MEITSHFVGVSLNNLLFADLFVDLQTYLKNNSIEECLTLQNPLSLHITLYYFPKDIVKVEMTNIKEIIKAISHTTRPEIQINGFNYFKQGEQAYLCYLSPLHCEKLQDINDKFRGSFANTVTNNTHSYAPHITFFHINNYNIFTIHKAKLESIMGLHLIKIQKENVFTGFNLYAVNSYYEPQIQIVI
ncbi:MAG: AKAP7 2'5' RNA ligase-like domain-containing protein [bacterium]|nr:AKAP7 2'5' RNA ligase-like domain-containing protein [bacterium]